MLVLKAALLGAPKSGKTQLMNRVKAAGYSDDYVASEKQSLAVVNRMLQTEEPIMLTTMLWEIPGTLQSKLQSQEFDVVFLCFDPRNQESFDALEEKINAQLNNGAGYDFVLIETKSDLDDAAIAVSETQLEAFKNKYGITRHVKTSAKADTGIDKVIDALQQVAQKQVEEEAQLLERSQHVSSLFGSSGKDREAGVQEWSSLPSTQPPSAPQPPAPLKPFKVSVLGGAESGKTQLILRIDSDTFSEHYRKTLGIDFSTKKFSTRAGAEFAAMFWDTPGVEAIPGSTMASLLDPNVVFLCFDPRNRNSFEAIKEKTRELANLTVPCPLVLIETKSDLTRPEIAVSEAEIEAFKQEYQIEYFVKTSAKDKKGIDDLLKVLLQIIQPRIAAQTAFMSNAKPTDSLLKQPHQDETNHSSDNNTRPTPVQPKNSCISSANTSSGSSSFWLDALVLTAAVSSLALCVAALVTVLVVSSLPLSAALLAAGAASGLTAAGAFFYRHNKQHNDAQQSLTDIPVQAQ